MAEVGDALGGKYRLERLIGKGGMGKVYEAHHEEIGKRVAVKCISPKFAEDEGAVARFFREARAAAAIGHRSIIDVYDVGSQDDGSIYMVMEFLEGRSLGEVLFQRGQLDPVLTAYVTCQVLSALSAAHEKGVVHRDLKPDNIFLVSNRQAWPEVKLLDFGISKIIGTLDTEERLTATGAVLGTPYYMSPEQTMGRSDIDHRIDIYSMGVILYECITGTVPFKGKHAFALVNMILHSPVVAPRDLEPDLSEGYEAVILKAMERDREQRFETASDMFGALLPFVDQVACGRISFPDGIDVGKALSGLGSSGVGSVSYDGIESADRAVERSCGDVKTIDSGVERGEEPSGEPWASVVEESEVSPRSQPTVAAPSTDRKPAVAIWSGVVAILLAAGIGYVVFGNSDVETTTAADDTSRDESVDESAVVTVTLEGVPDGGTVWLDEVQVEGRSLRLPSSSGLRDVMVKAPGYATWRRRVPFENDATIVVSLTSEATDANVGGSDAASDASEDSEADVAPLPSSARPGTRPGPPRPGPQRPIFDTQFPRPNDPDSNE